MIYAEESSPAKRAKVDVESRNESTEPGQSLVIISEALAKFLGPVGREMTQMDVSRRVWDYIKVNHLEVGGRGATVCLFLSPMSFDIIS